MLQRSHRQLAFPMLVAIASALLACSSGEDDDEPAADGGIQGGHTDQDAATWPVANTSTGDWVMLGGDLSSQFRNTYETKLSVANASKLEEKWTLPTSGAPNGTPALVGDDLFITSAATTYCVDKTTGTKRWSIPLGATSSPAYADGVLYVNGKQLHALDAQTGETLWKKPLDAHKDTSGFSSPVIAKHLVIVGTSSSEEITGGSKMPTFRGSVLAFDRETGEQVWRHYTVDADHVGATVWSTVSVDLDADMVFVSTGNNYAGEDSGTSDSILALDLETGEELWHTQVTKNDVWSLFQPDSDDSDFGTNPILFEAKVDGKPTKLVGAGQKSGIFWAMNRMTGKIVWSQTLSGGTEYTGGILNNGAFDGEHILVASNTGTSDGPGSEADRMLENSGTSRLAALDPSSGAIVWERQLGAFVWGPISTANGVGFVSSENQFEAFDVKTGERLYTHEVEGTVTTAAVVSNGYVYFGSGLSYFAGITGQRFYALMVP